jgi:hypothetical protein
VTVEATTAVPEEASGDQRLAILLAMAMFVLVVDTSLMNVSISAVVHDLDTTASGVQSAIALEALVSAAFILIGSKVGDLFGRKRAYILGLLGYAVGALSMTVSQSLLPIVVFWAIVGGLGASLSREKRAVTSSGRRRRVSTHSRAAGSSSVSASKSWNSSTSTPRSRIKSTKASCSWRAWRTQITSSKRSSWQFVGVRRSCARSGRCTITVRSSPTSECAPRAVSVTVLIPRSPPLVQPVAAECP